MYKCIFLDLDDTLWDFHANAKSVLNEIYENRNFGEYFDNFEQYFSIYAKRNLELWVEYGKGEVSKEVLNLERFLHPLIQVGIGNKDLAREIGQEYLDMLPSRNALIPFAKELLDYLNDKYPLTIVSNGFIEVQYKKLKSSNLEHYFKHIVLSEAAKALKPDKRIFEYALSLNNAQAAETIMIGDSYESDIIGAKNAGIDQIYFNPNPTEKELQISASFKVQKLEEILQIL